MRMILSFVLLAALAGTIPARAHADASPTTKITRDQYFIYIRTPWKEMADRNRREAVDFAIGLAKEQLHKVLPIGGGKMEQVVSSMEHADLLDQLMKYAEQTSNVERTNTAIRPYMLIPSGFMIFVGVNCTSAIGLKAGGTAAFGVVIVPVQVKRIPIHARAVLNPDGTPKLDAQGKPLYDRPVASYLEFSYNLIGMVGPNVGLGVTAQMPIKGRGGVGLIFGEMQSAKDFVGAYAAATGSISVGSGILAQAGVLQSTNLKRRLYFLTGGLQYGGIDVSAHISANAVIPLDKLLGLFGDDGNGVERKASTVEPSLPQGGNEVLRQNGIEPEVLP